MHAFVTGGAGFIGSHLVEELLKSGYSVTALDDLSTGSVDNVRHLLNDTKFKLHIDTIMNKEIVNELMEHSDACFHLAAAVGVKLIVEQPLTSFETNIKGTDVILQSAYKHNVKVLLASTSEIYGKNGSPPYKEDDDRILGPTTINRWSYSTSKAVDEIMALAYWREKKLPTVILRFFNTVGPRQTGRYGMVVPRFVEQALKGEPLTVYGDGRQSRCFGYVGDVVRGVIDLSQEPKACGEVFNIGNYKKISILDLAKLVKKMTKSKSEIVFVPYDKAYEEGFEDMMHRAPDLTKIQDFIGYEPQVDLMEIIERIINYINTQKSGKSDVLEEIA